MSAPFIISDAEWDLLEIAAHSYTPTLDILLSFFCNEQYRCEIVGNYFPCGLCRLRSCLIYRVGLPTGLKGKKKNKKL